MEFENLIQFKGLRRIEYNDVLKHQRCYYVVVAW
jgi:hypothetical protein